MRHLVLLALVFALSVCFLSVGWANAATLTWTDGSGDNNWATGGNWSSDTAPGDSDYALFYGVAWSTPNVVNFANGTTTVGTLGVWQDWTGWSFTNASATLNVTGSVYWADGSIYSQAGGSQMQTIAPVLNVAGQIVTEPVAYGAELTLTNNGNTVGGGLSISGESVHFNGNNNVVGTGITVLGDSGASWTEAGYGLDAGGAVFVGTGNAFSGTWNLNRYGYIDLQQTSNLTGVTAFNFNGGMLRLRAAGNTFAPSISNLNVAAGTLFADVNALSSYTGTISLGSAYNYGTLAGGTWNASTYTDNAIANSITLNGNGGMIRAYQAQYDPGSWSRNSVSGSIGGSGQLIKIGNAATYLSAFNTYTGGTIAAGGYLEVTRNSSLGTGNVVIPYCADLQLDAETNVASGASVLVTKSGGGFGGVLYSGVLDIQGDFLPTIDPASNGILRINGAWAGAQGGLSTALATAAPGDGTMWLGGQNWASLEISGMNPGLAMTADGKPTYRFSSGQMGFGWLNGETELYIVNGGSGPALTGNADVYVYSGGIKLPDPQDFTGTLTIRDTIAGNWNYSGVFGFAQSTAGQSSFGSETGNVDLISGIFRYQGMYGGVMTKKGDLNYTGGDITLMDSGGGNLTEMTFATMTRVANATMVLWDLSGDLGVHTKLRVTAAPTVTNGMVDPYIVTADYFNTGSFVTYNDGFAPAPFVAFTGSETAGTAIAHATGATAVGNSNVYALRADAALTGGTVTLQSGGLILTGNGVTDTTNFASAPGKEMVIYANNNAYWGNQVTLKGTITSNAGLTKFGDGDLYLAADNTSTLLGNITVNQGCLDIYKDSALGAATNVVILNGGTLHAAPIDNSLQNINHVIAIGPAGGTINGDYYGAFQFMQSITDLDASNPGTLYIGNNGNRIAAHNTFSGTVVFQGGGAWLVDAWQAGAGADGIPGTGPILINSNGYLSIFRSTIPDMRTSSVTIAGSNGQLQLATAGAMIGSLQGSGTVVWGDIWSPSFDMTLTVGYDNKSTDFYGQMYDIEGRTGNVTKVGAGTLTLWGDDSWHGPTNINGGTLAINGDLGTGSNTRGVGSAVSVNSGGTLSGKGTVMRQVNVYSGGTLAGGLHITGEVYVNGGTVNVAGATIDGGLCMDTGSYSGSSTINGNAPDGWNGFGSESDGGIISGTHTINGGLTLDSWDAPAGLTGTNTINGNLEVGAYGDPATVSGTTTVNSPGGHVYLNGTMSGSNIINLGAGSMYTNYNYNGLTTLSGAGTFTGAWFMANPNTVVSGTYTFNSNVYLYNNTTLQGNHTIHGNFTTAPGTVSSHATIAPHNGDTAGTLTVVGNVTLGSSTVMNFNLGPAGTTGGNVNDYINITGNLSLDGTLNVNNLAGFATGTYVLIDYTGALTGAGLTLGTTPTGYNYTLVTTTPNEINLVVAPFFVPGDTNGDTAVNSLDIDAIYRHLTVLPPGFTGWGGVGGDQPWPWAQSAYQAQYDVNNDQAVNQDDVTYELRTFFLTSYSDANLDRATDFQDFQVLLDHWQKSGAGIGWAQADFNGDGVVDFLDFQNLLDYWNPSGWNFAPTQTPEPASLTLILLGGLALLRRNRK